MTCDEGRPCQRCIKREIGHLCHDERRPKIGEKQIVSSAPIGTLDLSRMYPSIPFYQNQAPQVPNPWPVAYMYPQGSFGNEFSVLTDFLETLDEGTFFSPTTVAPSLVSSSFGTSSVTPTTPVSNPTISSGQLQPALLPSNPPALTDPTVNDPPGSLSMILSENSPAETILPSASKTEKFLLTAADQEPGSRDERLSRVIRSKYEAGLLKPYNYVKGYARLSRWMDRNVSQESKQQILQPLSVLRPKFRAIAQSLRDLDLVFIEEAFERMLLDYDRVFSAMGVPACLWRRTGEIYKANREFTELIGVEGYMMRDGRLCIYELMAEESAVNYWEKYGHVAFDSSQKAVLTSCVLRYKPVLNLGSVSPVISKVSLPGMGYTQRDEENEPTEEGFINCCFSFTIRRDKWGIPSMIVGNFIRC